MKLFHYGCLNHGQLLPATIYGCCFFRRRNKPEGKNIIWTSPVNSKMAWQDCESFRGGPRWILELKASAKILVVDSIKSAKSLAMRFPTQHDLQSKDGLEKLFRKIFRLKRDRARKMAETSFQNQIPHLDWRAMPYKYDAFWLTAEALKSDRLGYFCGWDCETVVVFNTAAVANIQLST